MATRGSMPNAAAVSALHAAMDARSLLVGLTFTAQSPYTITCIQQQQQQQQQRKQSAASGDKARNGRPLLAGGSVDCAVTIHHHLRAELKQHKCRLQPTSSSAHPVKSGVQHAVRPLHSRCCRHAGPSTSPAHATQL
jgi:hypothetical protein